MSECWFWVSFRSSSKESIQWSWAQSSWSGYFWVFCLLSEKSECSFYEVKVITKLPEEVWECNVWRIAAYEGTADSTLDTSKATALTSDSRVWLINSLLIREVMLALCTKCTWIMHCFRSIFRHPPDSSRHWRSLEGKRGGGESPIRAAISRGTCAEPIKYFSGEGDCQQNWQTVVVLQLLAI